MRVTYYKALFAPYNEAWRIFELEKRLGTA